MDDTNTPSLITIDEAVQATQMPKTERKHLAAMIFIIGAAVVSLSLLIMIVVALLGARTGLETIFPFLNKQTTEDLRVAK